MAVKSKWTHFKAAGRSPSGKTRVWNVESSHSHVDIGEIKWYGPWRQYCFFPDEYTIYERQCLRDIATFCEEATSKQRRRK